MSSGAVALQVAPSDVDHGEVFTRSWVVELILDLVDYDAEADLTTKILLEPACGSGAFLLPVVDRLLESAGRIGVPAAGLADCIVALDLQEQNVQASRASVSAHLRESGVETEVADELATTWISQGDYLLTEGLPNAVDFVVGNPPYIRLESVPTDRANAYREAHETMSGRADIYVGFIERGLKALVAGGALGFICADRWMRNAYGSRLRALIADGWSVDAIVKMQGVDAFEEEVDAYPAITVISRRSQSGGPVVVKANESFGEASAKQLNRAVKNNALDDYSGRDFEGRRAESWSVGSGGWPDCSPARLEVLSHLDARFPALGDPTSGTSIGIGVATGADKIFLSKDDFGVESERLLPMALPRDIANGELTWSGTYLMNPWDEDGLVDLSDWPNFRAYLEQHQPALAARHTAKRGNWHRTIDRVNTRLFGSEKLYIPDFKDRLFPVLDEGGTYPHHNLYWVTSDEWEIRALGGFLLSDIANAFVEAYSVRMRGGYLRFQAQYLRRIRIPDWSQVSDAEAKSLALAFAERDVELASTVANRLLEIEGLPE